MVPSIHQMLALSHITNYGLSDWLEVFGIDLDLIFRLQLLMPRKRTTLLNATIYGTQAWTPWFGDRFIPGPVPPIAPLGQLLAKASPRRAESLLALNRRKFLYAKVGDEDVHAFPHLAPGSIVRADVAALKEMPPEAKTNPERRLFLLEQSSGWTCSQFVRLAEGRIMLRCPQRSCAPIELQLGKEVSVLGVVDAEIRPVGRPRCPHFPPQSLTQPSFKFLPPPNAPITLKDLLRTSRLRQGLSFREASSASRWIAGMLSDELYFAAPSTLSDYETLSAPPRHIQKIVTLCLLYCIDFHHFLRSAELPVDLAGCDAIPDELVPRQPRAGNRDLHAYDEKKTSQEHRGFLDSLVRQWEEIPFFLRHALGEISGLKSFSLSDLFWVGGDRQPLHPWLVNAALLVVNRRVKKPAPSTSKAVCETPFYLILKRDGSYLCGRCTLNDDKLTVHAYPGGPVGNQQFRNGIDAEVIGQVTTIVRRLTGPTAAASWYSAI